MKNEFENTPADYKKFYKQYLWKLILSRIIIMLVISFLFSYSYLNSHFESWRFILAMFGMFGFLVIISYFLPLLILFHKIKIRKAKGELQGVKMMSLTDEGILFKTEDRNELCQWNSLIEAGLVKDFIFLKLLSKKVLVIPKYIFENELELSNFLGDVNAKIILNHKSCKGIKKKTPMILYFLGLLCFIPFIGIAMGFVLIGLGTFRFKDKWLNVVGTISLMVCISFTYYVSQKLNKISKIGDVKSAAQTNMNDLMRNLEIYKMHNGSYPENLKQLQESNVLAKIYDPIQTFGKEIEDTGDEFNYKKVGDKYRLFSSGFDGKPHTYDDIYPTLDQDPTRRYGRIMEPK
jgi:hypothetical protein